MTPSEKLRLAIQYIGDARDQVEEAASSADPYVRTARRQSLKESIEAARELLAELERDHPGVTTPHVFDEGIEAEMSVVDARVWAYRIELGVMVQCYEDYAAARGILERVLAIRADSARDHAWLGLVCADLKDFDAAIAATERAISLDPDDIEFKRNLNDIRRKAEQFAAEQAASAKRSRWNIKSWLG